MYAARRYRAAGAFRFDNYTMTHADALVALSGGKQISAHFTSPPFHQREIKDTRVRTLLTPTTSWAARQRDISGNDD